MDLALHPLQQADEKLHLLRGQGQVPLHELLQPLPGSTRVQHAVAALKGFAGGTSYVASKFALTGMTECWRAELRKHNVRVMQVNPSEVITDFASTAGYDQRASDRKLRGEDIAHAIVSMLAMHDRGFVTDLTVFATNPD